jgi:hypothetical protein
MWIVLVIVAAVLVFAIAAVVIGREAKRLDALPPMPSFDVPSAVAHIGELLPYEISAQLSYEDVRRIVLLHLEDMRAYGIRDDRPTATRTLQPVVITEAAVTEVVNQARVQGFDYPRAHVQAVLDAELGYLAAIGAVGPQAVDEA